MSKKTTTCNLRRHAIFAVRAVRAPTRSRRDGAIAGDFRVLTVDPAGPDAVTNRSWIVWIRYAFGGTIPQVLRVDCGVSRRFF